MGDAVKRDPGSFRDPSGYVIYRGDRVYRSLDQTAFELAQAVIQAPSYRRLAQSGLILPGEMVSGDEAHELAELEGIRDRHYIRQRRLDFISYPYEWSPAMLLDAARRTIELESALLDDGYNLKDASAYNVQFELTADGPAPVFIDLTSIERTPPSPLWLPYNQFMRHFGLPLMLHQRNGHDFRPDFIADLEGIDPERAYSMTGALRRFTPPYLGMVTLPHLLRRWGERQNLNGNSNGLKISQFSAERNLFILKNTTRRLRRLIERLERGARRSNWSGYEADNSYPASAMAAKEQFVATVCEKLAPRRMVNLGCNLGKFDFIAAAAGAEVIALDFDLASVDVVYRRARERKARVLPLRVDLAAPSPALGWNNRERRALLERLQGGGGFDAVMALAVVHHLLVRNRVPLAEIVDFIAAFGGRYLILELIDRSDPMFCRLARGREHLYAETTVEAQATAFVHRFKIVEQRPLPEMNRTLYLMERAAR
jgi:SAM-dependent methyltransferase